MTTESVTAQAVDHVPALGIYDRIIVAFSGGKDSLACLLRLVDLGVDLRKVELWHHEIDGREGSDLMDWTCTKAYCEAIARAFNVPIYFSWLEGGFEREMNRDNCPKAATVWENPDGSLGRKGGDGDDNTRLVFPQQSADLTVRWCSAYLKVDVMTIAIKNQPRFQSGKTLVVTGERAAESSARAKYKVFEKDRSDTRDGKQVKRWVDHWRPVHGMSTADVWALIAKHKVNPHPAYRAGFGRVSCQFCIFANADQCASARAISPDRFAKLPAYEAKFGKTINRRQTITALADKGSVYAMSPADAEACRSSRFDEPVFVEAWTMPLGAFAEACGPV